MRSWKILVFLLICGAFLSGAKPDDRLARELGQNLIVGIPGKTLDERSVGILRRIKPGGIVLFRWNYESNEQFKALIAKLQEISIKETGRPFFIMIDEEPGGAMRIGLFKNILPDGIPDWEAIEKSVRILAGTGVNVDLAPIADFPFNGETFIKKRIPFKSAIEMKAFNRRFIKLLKKYGISATLKHFPGMGSFATDPHRESAYSDMDDKTLESSLDIFKDGINSGADFIMTGHGIYNNIDPEKSATFSSHIVNNLLKKRMGFRGIIITDDLSGMPLGGGRERELAGAGIEALMAGHNMIMFAHRLEYVENLFNEMFAKVEKDPALQKLIGHNYQKVIRFKDR